MKKKLDKRQLESECLDCGHQFLDTGDRLCPICASSNIDYGLYLDDDDDY